MKPSELPPRQLKVLRGIATGRPPKQIASDLGMTYRTFTSYRAEAYAALGVHSAVEAVNALREDAAAA